MKLEVEPSGGMLHLDRRSIPCSIGRSGTIDAAHKIEGDGATPIGRWPIRAALLQPDRIVLPSAMRIPWRWLRPLDGWSDDPADPAYNRPVRHPHGASAEYLWRADGLYDIVVVLGHNDRPPVPGRGSAIFLHCWNGGAPTEGCVAIARDALLDLLPLLGRDDVLQIGAA